MKKVIIIIIPVFFLIHYQGKTQTDSLVFDNQKTLVGVIKSMEKGVLSMSTSFSKDDFKIKWEEIHLIYSERPLMITTSDGQVILGLISSVDLREILIKTEEDEEFRYNISEIIYLKPISRRFLDRLKASMDFGFNLAKAQNNRQLLIRSRVAYISEYWLFNAAYNTLHLSRNQTENINRSDGNLIAKGILLNDFFIKGKIDYLKNTEQKLDLRTNYKLGGGKYFVRNNHLYWNASLGGSYNWEQIADNPEDRYSSEFWLGSEVSIFNAGNIGLFSNIFGYYGISETGRFRLDFRLDLKYNLPLKLYIKTGITLNHDNQPVPGAAMTDYVWGTTLGWSW
ncbi:Protein of unknown function, DUF481 [Cyclobacterium xiamenense]|uniref:DUF481 domain-containing protein n=1 Tax=Cyclobacterium xiamenense TaxID=1297121 RepID=A0A1H6WYV4_9BACT|nr:DUF481 domain-containing protein [Cyclobacterium xiamenense]SEJ21056.1 Protein of unknown function, DUF481 [Cyclobacterium xiamenense]